MVFKRIILFLFLSGLPIAIQAQSFIKFCQGWIGGEMIELQKGKYLMCGTNELVDSGVNRFHVQFNLLDSLGNITDSSYYRIPLIGKDTFYEGAENSMDHSMCIFNGHVLHGLVMKKNHDFEKDAIVEMDDSLKYPVKITEITLLGGRTQPMEMLPVSNNRLIISGMTLSKNKDAVFYWLMEMDSNLNVRWTRSYPCYGCFATPQKILKIPGGYLLASENADEYSGGVPGYYSDFVSRLDSTGVPLWNINFATRTISSNNLQIAPSSDGNFIACWNRLFYRGWLNNPNGIAQYLDTTHIMLAKFDLNGHILKQRDLFEYMHLTYGIDTLTAYENTDMTVASDGSVVVTGSIYVGQMLDFVMDIDSALNIKWFHAYDMLPANKDSLDDQYFHSIKTTSSGNFILAGEYTSFPSPIFPQGIQSAVAIMLDKNGCLKDNCGIVGIKEVDMPFVSQSELTVYPDPATDKIYLRSCLQRWENAGYTITNSLGQPVLNGKYSDGIAINLLPSGMYHLQAHTVSNPTQQYYASFIKK
jgi:hypothetical protein